MCSYLGTQSREFAAVLEAVQSSVRLVYSYVSNRFHQCKASVEMDCHMAMTSSLQDSVGICKIHTACRPFYLSLYLWFFEQFFVFLSQLHMQ